MFAKVPAWYYKATKMKKAIVAVVFLLTIVFTGQVKAADVLYFDSTDHYLGACQLTNKSDWELKDDTSVSIFEIWYSWNQGETTLPVKLFFNGEKFAEFEATRGSCDPYQKQWCNADYQINKLFPKGKYSTEIPNARQCLKPGGTGAVRLYVNDSAVSKPEPSVTIAPIITEPVINQVKPTEIVVNQTPGCSRKPTTTIITAAVTSIISSLLVFLVLKK